MAEPQFLFSEIPLSRAAFDRWLKSAVPVADKWPVPALAVYEPSQSQTIIDALLPYFTAAADTLRCLLLHDKERAVLHCALWLDNQEQRSVMMQLVALLSATAPFMAAGKTGIARHGENISGTLHISKAVSSWDAECTDPSFPAWADEWLCHLGNIADDDEKPWIDSKVFNQVKRRYNHYLRNATPQNRIPIKKTERYLSDGTHVVNFQGYRVPGANPLTFRRISNDSVTSIYTDDCGIWIDCFSTGEERRQLAYGLKKGDFEVWQEDCDAPFLLRIRNEAWFIGYTERNFELQSHPVDAESLYQITWGEFADKNYFYLLNGEKNGLVVIPDIDVNSIRKFSNVFFFAGDQVYSRGKVLPDADAATFRSLGGDYYADDRHIWHRTILKSGIDPATFEWLDQYSGLAKDIHRVFMNEINFPEADVQTASVVAGGMFLLWRDKNSIWYHDKKLIGADVSRDKPYPWRGSMYCQIGDQIWFGQDRLVGADAVSFFITGWDSARDKHGAWYRDSRRDDDGDYDDGNDE